MRTFFQNNKHDIVTASGLILFVIFMCLLLIWRHNYWERITEPRYVTVVMPFENGDTLTTWIKTSVSEFDSLETCLAGRFFWSQQKESLSIHVFKHPSTQKSYNLECVKTGWESEGIGVWNKTQYATQYHAVKEGFVIHDPLWKKPW